MLKSAMMLDPILQNPACGPKGKILAMSDKYQRSSTSHYMACGCGVAGPGSGIRTLTSKLSPRKSLKN